MNEEMKKISEWVWRRRGEEWVCRGKKIGIRWRIISAISALNLRKSGAPGRR
jgi:hypothetical protein